MAVSLIERTSCAVTGARDLEPLHKFAQFPVFMGCVDQPPERDVLADMDWGISRSSGLIQLRCLVPLPVLYPESHGSGCVGAQWERHHQALATFVNQFSPSAVLEIGGAHGMLARAYQQFGQTSWTILEPNPSPVEGCDARFIKGFFDETFSFAEPLDAVVHSHVFEHIYEPDKFMSQLSGFMGPGTHLIFSLPNMRVMLERKFTNCVNFEHTTLLTEEYVQFLLARHGFRLLRKDYFMDDHSIFYAAVRDSSTAPVLLPPGLYEQHRKLYREYIHYHEELVRDLNRRTNASAGPVYLFGAHVIGQYMLAFGLDSKAITSVIDNDKRKHGRRLYGTRLTVESPTVLANVEKPTVILRAGVHNAEIKAEILGNINSSTMFLE